MWPIFFLILVIPAQAGINSQPGKAAKRTRRAAGFPPAREWRGKNRTGHKPKVPN